MQGTECQEKGCEDTCSLPAAKPHVQQQHIDQ